MMKAKIFAVMLLLASQAKAQSLEDGALQICLSAARVAASQIENREGEREGRLLCDEQDTGFFVVRVRYHRSSDRSRGGLEQLFWQRTPAHLTAQSEGREIRLTYTIEPNETYQDIWNISVKDAVNNKRLNRDFIWARNFRGLDGTAPASLLLGAPLVYFACTKREGFTCVTHYNVDKCYGIAGSKEALSRNTHYYDISVAMIGEENVQQAFSNYEPVNQLAEDILEIVSPAICANYVKPRPSDQ